MRRTDRPGSLPALTTQAEFDLLARVHHAGTVMRLAHVMFVIDLNARPARIYYVDTPRYELHERFVVQAGLVPPGTSQRELDKNYGAAQRRFVFGTLSWQANIAQFTYEFWEGDRITPALLLQTEQSLKASFFAPLKFKTNSTLHERRAQEVGVAFVTQEALIRDQPYLPLNMGRAVGRLRIVESGASVNGLLPGDIAVLRQVPISLPPVAGVLTERPSTAISHVNLLAKGWGIPNAYVRDAAAALHPSDRRVERVDAVGHAELDRLLRGHDAPLAVDAAAGHMLAHTLGDRQRLAGPRMANFNGERTI